MSQMEKNFCCDVLGCHLGIEKTMSKSLKTAYSVGCFNPQYFLGNPMTIKRKVFAEKDLEESKNFIKSSGQNVFSHLPYTFNLAGFGSDKKDGCRLGWDGDEEIDVRLLSITNSIEHEMSVLGKLGCNKSGCVLHMGSYPNRELGLDAIVKTIDHIDFKDQVPLVLETMVGNGNVLGRSFDDLSYVREHTKNRTNIKYCIDTCHIFAQGLYDLQSEENINKLYEDIDRELGIDNIAVVHLNDSKKPFAKKADRHQLVCQGEIWKGKEKEFLYFVKKTRSFGIPLVLETNGTDLEVVHKLYSQ